MKRLGNPANLALYALWQYAIKSTLGDRVEQCQCNVSGNIYEAQTPITPVDE